MVPLFQLFEFTYPNGFLFFDRSGIVSRRLQEMLPGLVFKSATADQRDLTLPAGDVELLFGVSFSRIQTIVPDSQDFPMIAANFQQIVTEHLEITQLNSFYFRYVLGKPCESEEEAHKLMWPLVPEETKAKMSSVVEPAKWNAIQGEFRLANFACQSRIAILTLFPHKQLLPPGARSDQQVPHITFQLDIRGVVPIETAKFDAEAFMKNVRENHAKEILTKLAPHLA
jgi:hypothetical protein